MITSEAFWGEEEPWPGNVRASRRHRGQRDLLSLAAEFESGQHGIYVRQLEEGVLDKRNRNIALTGRYGAGKSSVLDDFQGKHRQHTVRISTNTLGPD